MTKRKTKNSRGRTDHMELVEEILYRFGGGVAEQVARAMLIYSTVMHERKDPYSSALEAARRTLRVMRESGQVESISIRRSWAGKQEGRHEGFYRLMTGKDSLVEGAIAAGVDGQLARRGYARPWSGGGLLHAAQRNDLLFRLIETSEAFGAKMDLDSVYSETAPGFPLVGSMLPLRDAGGLKVVRRETAGRKYERVVPDAEFVSSFEEGISSPFYVELERRINSSEITRKIQRYSGHWLRLLDKEQRCAVRPILFVLSEPRDRAFSRSDGGAAAMRDRVRQKLMDAQDAHYFALDRRLYEKDTASDLGRMFLFADYEQFDSSPFGEVFFPISRYLNTELEDQMWMGLAAWDRSCLMRELGEQEGDKPV